MDEVRKVNALDQAIRELRMNIQPPWTLKKTTVRIFSDVYTYPIASDHQKLAFLSSSKDTDSFADQPRYVYTSIKDFIEDPTPRNVIAEVWDSGVKTLGVRNKTDDHLTSLTLDSAEDVSKYSTSDDAGTPVLDTVMFKSGNASIRVPITSSTGTATILDTFSSQLDTNYKRKYHFKWLYLDSAPTSIEMRLETDASNYLSSTVTTQFDGRAFAADDWNLIAMDLNTATVTGTIGAFTQERFILTGAGTGTYYFDASYLKGWILQDYRYYSSYNVLDGSTYQPYFAEDGATYNTSAYLLGDTLWHDVIVSRACSLLLADQKEEAIRNAVDEQHQIAYTRFIQDYPDLSPKITTNSYRFETDYRNNMGYDINFQ
jgi:hypothetical protein